MKLKNTYDGLSTTKTLLELVSLNTGSTSITQANMATRYIYELLPIFRLRPNFSTPRLCRTRNLHPTVVLIGINIKRTIK
eukprot:g24163.t1